MGHFKPPLILAFPQKWQAWGSWCPMNCSCNRSTTIAYGDEKRLTKDMLCQSRIVWEAFLSVCKIETPIFDGGNVFCVYILTRTPHAFHLCEWMKPSLITGSCLGYRFGFTWDSRMSQETLGSLPSQAWSCKTLQDGVAACARIAGLSLEAEDMTDAVQVSWPWGWKGQSCFHNIFTIRNDSAIRIYIYIFWVFRMFADI